MQQAPCELKSVTIYTDGACIGNPGPGGFGVVLLYNEKRREISGGFRRTTNNRMEIMAAIAGLEVLLFPCRVTIYTDSQYLVNTIMKGWAVRWRANGWMRNREQAAVNADLWERLLNLCERHEVGFEWVKGHAGDTENERCDRLSVKAAEARDLPVDAGYDRPAPRRGGALFDADQTHETPRASKRDDLPTDAGCALNYATTTRREAVAVTGKGSKKKRHAGEQAAATRAKGSTSKNQSPDRWARVKVTEVGHPCRKCGAPVISRVPRGNRKPDQAFYYEYYLACPQCHTMYMVDAAKRSLS